MVWRTRAASLGAVVAAVIATGCQAFDERWTEIFITADPEVTAAAETLSYCVWDAAGEVILDTTRDGESTAGLPVRPGCAEGGTEYMPGTAPIPGTVVIENGSPAGANALTFFQLVLRPGAGVGRCADSTECPCYDGCPPATEPAPGTNVCVSSQRGAFVLLPEGDEPLHYALHFTTTAPFRPEQVDATEPMAGCP